MADDWLNLSRAAALLGVHPSTLRAWADRGDLPTHRTPGRHRRFRRSEVEDWAASRREAKLRPGQLVVENALGRVRMQMAEGSLGNQSWYRRLGSARRLEFRAAGRRLLGHMTTYLGAEGASPEADADSLGREYEQLGRSAGLSLTETVSVFLYFRDFLYQSMLDQAQASGGRAAREWLAVQSRISTYTNRVLLALVQAGEAGRP